MNKKILAVAVIAAMSASAAQADVKWSGGLQAEVAVMGGDVAPETGITMGDTTTQQGNKGSLGVSWTDGDMFGKINLNAKVTGFVGPRDMFVGTKIGGGKIQAGTFSSAYKTTGGVKIDPFLATGLQARSSGGGQSKGQDGYITGIGYRAKMGALDVKVDFVPETVGCANATTCGVGKDSQLGLGIAMDLDAVNVFVGMDNFKTSGGDSAIKFGAKMKMGKMNLAAQIETGMTAYQGSTEDALTFVSLSMPMGGMTLGAWVGIGDDTSFAVGVKKAVSKKSMVYAGLRSTAGATGITAGLRTGF